MAPKRKETYDPRARHNLYERQKIRWAQEAQQMQLTHLAQGASWPPLPMAAAPFFPAFHLPSGQPWFASTHFQPAFTGTQFITPGMPVAGMQLTHANVQSVYQPPLPPQPIPAAIGRGLIPSDVAAAATAVASDTTSGAAASLPQPERRPEPLSQPLLATVLPSNRKEQQAAASALLSMRAKPTRPVRTHRATQYDECGSTVLLVTFDSKEERAREALLRASLHTQAPQMVLTTPGPLVGGGADGPKLALQAAGYEEGIHYPQFVTWKQTGMTLLRKR